MPSVGWLAAVVVLAYVGWRFVSGMKRASAANNVVAAAATFAHLPPESQAQVTLKASEIIRRSGWPPTKPIAFPSEVAKFGWYALAMKELQIRPVCLTTHWASVRNPFHFPSVSDSMLDTATRLARRAGYDVTIHREFDLLGNY